MNAWRRQEIGMGLFNFDLFSLLASVEVVGWCFSFEIKVEFLVIFKWQLIMNRQVFKICSNATSVF